MAGEHGAGATTENVPLLVDVLHQVAPALVQRNIIERGFSLSELFKKLPF